MPTAQGRPRRAPTTLLQSTDPPRRGRARTLTPPPAPKPRSATHHPRGLLSRPGHFLGKNQARSLPG